MKRTSLLLSDDQDAMIASLAKAIGKTKSYLLRKIISEYLLEQAKARPRRNPLHNPNSSAELAKLKNACSGARTSYDLCSGQKREVSSYSAL